MSEYDDPKELERVVPCEWKGNFWKRIGYIFDFGSISPEELSVTVKNYFKGRKYRLGYGTSLDGFYTQDGWLRLFFPRSQFGSPSPAYPKGNFKYRFKIKIYSMEGKTFLEIYKGLGSITDRIRGEYWGLIPSSTELNRCVTEIKLLKYYEGCLVCERCGYSYKLQPYESPGDFVDECECGGKLEYHYSIDGYHPGKYYNLKTNLLLILVISILLLLILIFVAQYIYFSLMYG